MIVNGTTRVRSHDLRKGKVLWEYGGMTVNAIPSPVAADGVVYCMTGYRGALAVAVPLDSRGDLSRRATKSSGASSKGRPTFPRRCSLGDRLYFTQANDRGSTAFIDIKTGKPLVQRETSAGREDFLRIARRRRGPRCLWWIGDGTCLVLRQPGPAGGAGHQPAGRYLSTPRPPSPAGNFFCAEIRRYLQCMEVMEMTNDK